MKNIISLLTLIFFCPLLSGQVTIENNSSQIDNAHKSNEYDLGLETERINFWTTGEVFGESGFYGQLPISQLYESNDTISFSGIVKNYGTIAVTPQLQISVKNSYGIEVYTQSITMNHELEPGQSDTLTTLAPYFKFNECYSGYVKFDFSTSIIGHIDDNPENNVRSDSTLLTFFNFARDNDSITGSISACDFAGGCHNGNRIGVIYSFSDSQRIRSVDFWVSESTQVGSTFIPILFTYDECENDWVEFASGTLYEINEEDLGTLKSVIISDDNYVYVLENEEDVLVAIECYSEFESGSIAIGIDETTPTNGYENRIYLASENVWTCLEANYVPVIRLNFEIWEDITTNDQYDIGIFPNPTTGIIKIEDSDASFVEVVNIAGKTLKRYVINSNNSQIDLSEFENGTYFLEIHIDNKVIVKKIILIK